MRICFLGPANSAHIIKWCNWFISHGHEVHVITFTQGKIPGATVHFIDVGANPSGSDLAKLKYLLTGSRIKKVIKEIQPDIVNAHYATSYGVAVALSGVKGYVLSVWGSDIYDFPKKSPLHKALLKYSLRKAGVLFSTSYAMADEASKYTDRKFEITPFGVDMNLFNPNKRTRKTDIPFTVGTVKSLSELYGIDYILKAVSIINKEHPEYIISVRIAGDGVKKDEYTKLAKELHIERNTTFLGKISQEDAANEWANMDVAVIPSIHESFGVAAVEAQASGIPLVISDVGGLLETSIPGKSSIVVPIRDERAIANALIELHNNPELRRKMGILGRRHVMENFELNYCFGHIESLFINLRQI